MSGDRSPRSCDRCGTARGLALLVPGPRFKQMSSYRLCEQCWIAAIPPVMAAGSTATTSSLVGVHELAALGIIRAVWWGLGVQEVTDRTALDRAVEAIRALRPALTVGEVPLSPPTEEECARAVLEAQESTR